MSDSDAALERLRQVCFGFAGTEEKVSHGAPAFHVRGKMFATFADDHHGDGRVAAWLKATHEEQKRLVASDPDRYFVPPYVGVSGWVGAILNHPRTDWIELAIVIEEGWRAIVPPSVAKTAPKPPPKPPVYAKTDPEVARAARAKLDAICAKLPETVIEKEGKHSTYRVAKKVYAYFLDNHHGDGYVAACVKTAKGENAKLAKRDPKRFFLPAYIAARGYVGMRIDTPRVDWKEVAERVAESWRSAAPKRLVASLPRR